MIILLSLCFFGLVVSFACISKNYLKTWLNPVSVFVSVWGINLVVFSIFADQYIKIHAQTWLVLLASFVTYLLGIYSFWFGIPDKRWLRRNLKSEDRIFALRSTIDKGKMRVAIYFLIVAGGIFFFYFLISVGRLQGFNRIIYTLLDTRSVMKNEGALPGFHYLYFWEMLLPLTVLYILLFGKRSDLMLVIVVLILTLCLVLTGAKTNIAKSLMWSFVFYSLLKFENIQLKRIVVISISVIFSGIFLFFVHTGFTGELKNFHAQFREVILRFSAQFPTFQLLINDSSISHSYGSLIFHPVAKLAQLVWPEMYVPSHILDFYPVPYWFNLATYLDVFYRDFGVVGVVMLPWFFGVLSGSCFYLYCIKKNNFFVLFAFSIILLWTIASPSTAGFIKPSFWFQIIFCYFVHLLIKNKPKCLTQ